MKPKLIYILILSFIFNTSLFSQKIKIGGFMPHFELMDQHSEYFNSKDYIDNKAMVVFFYTKNNSPTCTRQVLSFNNRIQEFKDLNAVVVGINPASVIYHRKFVIKLNIEFPVLFDRNSFIQKKFKVPNIKKTKTPQRYTFIVDKNGIIKNIIRDNENADLHIIEALKTLKNLVSSQK